MFGSRYWAARYWGARYWAKIGGAAPTAPAVSQNTYLTLFSTGKSSVTILP